MKQKVKLKVAQPCLTLCDTTDGSPPGSSVHEILQARILDWVAIPVSRDLPDPGLKPRSPALPADALPSEPPRKPLNFGESEVPFTQFPKQRSNPHPLSWKAES